MTILWRSIIVPSKSIGKIILKIKINKKNVVITFEDKSKLTCVSEVLASFYLYTGKTLTYKEIKEIEEFNAGASLMKYALSLLKKNHYSEWKMREKLYAKEGSKKDVDRIIKMLKNNDLINDQALMEDLIEYGHERNLGKNKIIQVLLNKGIFEENINKNLFPSSFEKKKALNQLPKLEKKYSKYPFEQKKQHIYRALLTLGFDNDIAMNTINRMSLPKDKDEHEKLVKDFDKTLIRLKRSYEGYELKNKVISSLRTKGYKLKDIMNMWEKRYGENDF